MSFLSDTTAPAHPSLIEAIARANTDFAPSYGADAISARVKAQLCEIFETDLEVLFVISGTASNALALSILADPDGAIFCHDEAHIHRDERGAPEFFTQGAKLIPLHGEHGRIDPKSLEAALAQWPRDFLHAAPPQVLSLSQLNEAGCAYSRDQLDALIAPAKAAGLKIHMDGARFANALVTNGLSPAELTWKVGVDSLCMGATKNGALGAEAIILFPSVKDRFARLQARQKRAGHMAPKMRFIAAQYEAWLKDDLWLDLARHANAKALDLKAIFESQGEIGFAHPVEGNELFVHMPAPIAERLRQAGIGFYGWPDGSARFVTSWCTSDADIERVNAALKP
ncbi:threonine aldolase family protein [Woodsholea maritima]|uniref:threonine aldolase family protein n=1 Tax=Woodsholea maritima TaxID=240237 RepID=UPI00036CBD46|nr:beta-eliminating lyase-related protein [Woodsholea maritima]